MGSKGTPYGISIHVVIPYIRVPNTIQGSSPHIPYLTNRDMVGGDLLHLSEVSLSIYHTGRHTAVCGQGVTDLLDIDSESQHKTRYGLPSLHHT